MVVSDLKYWFALRKASAKTLEHMNAEARAYASSIEAWAKDGVR